MAIVHTPRVDRLYKNTLTTTKSSDQLIADIEKVSVTDAANMNDETAFIIESHGGSAFKLLSADYLRKHPNGKLCPTLELAIKDNIQGDGSVVGYKLDVQKNPVSLISITLMTCVFIAAFLWFVISIFVEINVLGIVLGGILTAISGWFVIYYGVVSTFKMLITLENRALK